VINLWDALDKFEEYIGETEPNRSPSRPLSRNEILVLTLFVQWLENHRLKEEINHDPTRP